MNSHRPLSSQGIDVENDTSPVLDLRSRVTKSSATVISLAVLTAPLGYGIRMILSRSLDQASFGLLYAVIALFTLVSEYNDLGFGHSVSFFLPKFSLLNNKVKIWNTFIYDLAIELGTATLISLAIYFASSWIADQYFHDMSATGLLQVGVIFFISHSVVSAIKKFFIGMQQVKLFGIVDVIYYSIVLLAVSVLFFFTSSTAYQYFQVWALAYLMTALITVIIFFTQHGALLQPPTWDSLLFQKMRNYAVPTLLTTSIGTILKSTDIFFLTLYAGLVSVGAYNIIFPIVNIPQLLLSPVRSALFPLVSELTERSSEQVSALINKVLIIVPIISFYFCFFFILYPEAIIQTLFGSKWIDTAAEPLRILSLAHIIFLTTSFLNIIVSGLGYIKERLYLSVVLAVGSIIAGLLLVRPFGLIGVAWGNLVLFLLSIVLHLRLISKRYQVTVPIILYIKIAAFAVLLLILKGALGIAPHGVLQIMVFGSIYTLLLLTFAVLQAEVRSEVVKSFALLMKRNT